MLNFEKFLSIPASQFNEEEGFGLDSEGSDDDLEVGLVIFIARESLIFFSSSEVYE